MLRTFAIMLAVLVAGCGTSSGTTGATSTGTGTTATAGTSGATSLASNDATAATSIGTGSSGASTGTGTTAGATTSGATSLASNDATASTSIGTASSSSGTTSGSGTSGGSSGSSGTSGNQCNGTACNQVTQVGAIIDVTQTASAPPAPLGGSVVYGTYALTGDVIYTGAGGASGPNGDSLQDTLTLTNNNPTTTLQEIVTTYGGGSCTLSETGTLTFSGTMATLSVTCPAGCTNCGGAVGLTTNANASPATFTIYIPMSSGGTEGKTYALQ